MPTRTFLKSKIHRATVTDANVDYAGSIALCPQLMEAAEILPFEMVHVNNVANGNHWETYVIPGAAGEVTLHGPPAHLFSKGDKIVINCWIQTDAYHFMPRVVRVDEQNAVTKVDHFHLDGNLFYSQLRKK